jgi:hypothetical protein
MIPKVLLLMLLLEFIIILLDPEGEVVNVVRIYHFVVGKLLLLVLLSPVVTKIKM